jgi:uncharacterized protein YbcV (DUF1398 family)
VIPAKRNIKNVTSFNGSTFETYFNDALAEGYGVVFNHIIDIHVATCNYMHL